MRRPLAAACAALAGFAALPAAATVIGHLRPSPAGTLALQALATSALLLGLALAGALLAREPACASLRLCRGRFGWPATLLLVVGLLALSHGLEAVLQLLELRSTGALAEIDTALQAPTRRQLGYALVGLALAPGIAEELFFRGLLQGSLERGLRRAAAALRPGGAPRLAGAAAVTLAAIAFGALHLDPVHAGAAAVLGLYLGAVALRDGSVRTAVVCHVANNAAAVLETALGWSPNAPWTVTAGVGIAGGAAALALAWPAARRGPDRRSGSVAGAGGHPVGELVADQEGAAQQHSPEREG